MGRSRRQKLPTEAFEVEIESMSHDGRGVTHLDGKAVFIDGALPGERVRFRYTAKSRKHDQGRVEEILDASPDRVTPRCSHAGICGGCSLQHLAAEKQIEFKQQAMLEGLKHIGKVEPDTILPPLTDNAWGYRHKARLGVRYVIKKKRVLVGFREKRNSFIADILRCEVLHPSVGTKIVALSELIGSMDAASDIPQIEVAVSGENTALVFRHLKPLSEGDCLKLKVFSEKQNVIIFLQSGGADTVIPLDPESQPELTYPLPDYNINLGVEPLDFFQINAGLNNKMLAHALRLLDLQPNDKVLDLFCGLGNFTLPISRSCAEVIGVEGESSLVKRARDNALKNGITNTRYFTANLMSELDSEPWLSETYDKILLDPPRLGAKEVIPELAKLGAKRIVYVSCHPGTLARDAGEIVHSLGYKLTDAGVMDMFPHTSHVESIAVFVKG
ncbi:MAG: 23S rRNA (uracil(1939)-C(5))-methyltransferase RlmD [Thiothrix sp.]|nr:MAG: 23S rRNA (uracil(1939)-C(5))-methyltransferase RlmD [Thiothrix sp.]